MSRPVEIAPGLLVNPDHVRVVRDEAADGRLVQAGHCVVVVGAGGFYVEGRGSAAEVAAKLWPPKPSVAEQLLKGIFEGIAEAVEEAVAKKAGQ